MNRIYANITEEKINPRSQWEREDKIRAFECQTHRPKYPPGYILFLLLKLLTHDIQNVKNKICAIYDIFAFYFPPISIYFSKDQGGSLLESDLCWRAGRWRQPQTSPVLLLDHVSLKSLEDLCAGDPKSPPESGSLAAQSPAKGTRVWRRPGKDHSSSRGQSDGQICAA